MAAIFTNYQNTILFYEAIFIVASLFACTLKWGEPVEHERHHGSPILPKGWWGFAASFLILWFFQAFARCGTDYSTYRNSFENSLNPVYWGEKRIESGYVAFSAITRFFTGEFWVYHIVWSTILMLLVFSTICYYREFVHPGLAVWAFANIYYVQSFDLMRIYFAAAILFFAFRFLAKRNYLVYALFVLLALSIHTSSIVCLLPLAIILFFRGKGNYLIKGAVGLAVFVAFFLFKGTIAPMLGYYYGANAGVSFGLTAFIYYLPLVAIFIYLKVKAELPEREDDLLNALFVTTMCSFALQMTMYIITIAGRLPIVYMPVFILFPSYSVYLCKKYVNKRWLTLLLIIFFVLFIAFRGYLMFEYLGTDRTSPYTNIFGWSI